MKRIVTALSLIVVGCQAANLEDNVLRMVEEGKLAQAQETVRTSGTSGKELICLEGILYHAYGQADSALAYLKQAHKDNASDPRITLLLAETLFWKKDIKAVRTLVDETSDKALNLEPRPWESLSRKARLESWLQEFDASGAHFEKLLASKETPDAYKLQARFHLAEIAAWKKDLTKSLSLLDALLAVYPGYVEAALLKGQILEWKGEYAQAKVAYTGALQVHPSDTVLRQRLEKLSWVK
jgi:tetratricopeptide (TPR) repeat protein